MLFMSVAGPSQAGCQSQELALGARQGKAQGLPQAPAMVTNVPLWLHRLETGHRQQGGRREGRKELCKTKVVLWTAIMDISSFEWTVIGWTFDFTVCKHFPIYDSTLRILGNTVKPWNSLSLKHHYFLLLLREYLKCMHIKNSVSPELINFSGIPSSPGYYIWCLFKIFTSICI